MDSGFNLSNMSMLELFSMELETQTEILTEKLLALEILFQQSQTSSNINPILETLMRSSHSIKGAARIVHIEVAVKLAHRMEDYFIAVMDGKIPLHWEQIDKVLQGVDFFKQLSKVRETQLTQWLSKHQEQAEHIIKEIIQLEAKDLDNKNNLPILAPESQLSEKIDEISAQFIDLEPRDLQSSLELSSRLLESQEIPPTAQQIKETLSSALKTISATPSEKNRFVRVSSDNLNRLMGLAGEVLVEASFFNPFTDSLLSLKKKQIELSKFLEKLDTVLSQNQLTPEVEAYLKIILQKEQDCREILSDRIGVLEQFSYRSTNLCDRLYREVIASQMRPFSEGVQGFYRMVRDIAKQVNKKVKLEIIGQAILVDRDILKKLEAPLTQMLRNAIDHGIESAEERLALGKPEEGTIKLEATHRFGMLSITLADDGRGINLEQLRQKIIDKQLVTFDLAQQLSENELIEFIFLPGFSTSTSVTELSGRGVGLNIAKTMVEEVGGNLQVTTKLSQGINFHFQLPLTLSVIRTLLVEISGEPYALPLTRIKQVIMLNPVDISYMENRQYFTLGEQHISLVKAAQILDLHSSKIQREMLSVVLLGEQINRYGLIVDRFLGERNLVIRPLDSRLGKLQDISAAALLEDGSPVLILDVLDLIRSIDKFLSSSEVNQLLSDSEDSIIKNPRKFW